MGKSSSPRKTAQFPDRNGPVMSGAMSTSTQQNEDGGTHACAECSALDLYTEHAESALVEETGAIGGLGQVEMFNEATTESQWQHRSSHCSRE